MSAPRERAADLARFYTVTEPQRHPRGYTVYKVTARVVSRRNPEDVQEIIVWKRYSDFKKLHKELWQIHKNLFRHSELFPPFAKGTVFGRFDANVIEERRQRAEDLLQFSAGIPALCHSRQLEAFFEGGIIHDGSELIGPAEGFSDSYVDSSATGSTEGFSSDSDLVSLTVDVDSLAELEDGMASRQSSPVRACGPSVSSDSAAPGAATSDGEPSRTDADRGSHSLLVGSLRHKLGKRDYLEKAGELIKLALKKEEEEDYEAASDFYRKGVDLLLEGVQGESSPSRREAVKRRTAEYLMRAESISSLPRKPQRDDLSQVLLVVDTRTEQTFILKGLRRSSECSGSRRTVIPRRVPNMVCLHKYIISEESVFLVLQPVEGGKLWSHISKFLSRSPEESPDPQGVQASMLQKAPLHLPTRVPQDGSSIESRGSDGASMLRVLPVKTSLTPSSQEDGTQEDESQDSSPKWPDSGSSSEEECTTSYLTLCNEYGQEKIAPGSLTEEPFMKTEDTRALQGFQVPLAADHGSPSAHLGSLTLSFLPGDETPEAGSSPRTSDSFSRSRNSPMEFFRIDSKDSTSEQLGLEFEEKLYSLKPEPLNPFFAFGDGESTRRAVSAGEGRAPFRAQDAKCRGSGDLVPVVSFREVAVGDVGGSEEGRPDLLVNLPGELEPGREAAAPGPAECAQTGAGLAESTLLGAPDVLCLRLSPEPGQPCGETGTEGLSEPHGSQSHSGPGKCYTQAELGTFFVAGGHHGFSGEASWLRSPDPKFQGLGVVGLALAADSTEEGLSQLSDPSSGASKSHSNDTDTFSTEEVLLFTDQADDPTGEEPAFLSQGGLVPAGTCGRAPEEDRRIRQLFEDLDRRLALSSRLHIPEAWVQRWAAEMVVALDALHREGIVCRDLNPNNILLNDRGHIQLTYFSRWSEVEDSCDNEAVERMYCAPEVGAITEETEACDWWSLGAVLFELLTGKTLAECHPAGINTHTILNVPECVSEEARSLIQQLLQFNPVERLGAGVAGVEDIKSHPFFNSVDWAALTR